MKTITSYQFTLLKMGELTVDKSNFTRGKDAGTMIQAPIWSLAVYGSGLKIIVDTGIADVGWVNTHVRPCVQKSDETMSSALAYLGWKAEDVDIVVNTHLHYDHCGNNLLFKNARYYFQQKEMDYARSPLPEHQFLYNPSLFDTPLFYKNVVFIEGEREIADGISLISTPGHSKGHQSVLVSTDEGVVCFAGDCALLLENLRENILGKITVSESQAYRSIGEIQKRARYIIPGHEPSIAKYTNEKQLKNLCNFKI